MCHDKIRNCLNCISRPICSPQTTCYHRACWASNRAWSTGSCRAWRCCDWPVRFDVKVLALHGPVPSEVRRQHVFKLMEEHDRVLRSFSVRSREREANRAGRRDRASRKRCVRLKMGLAIFIKPIGASGIGPGRRPGTNPSTTPFFEKGIHVDFSRWFYRTRPTLIGHLQTHPRCKTPQGTQADSVRDHRVGTSCIRRESSMGME